MKAAQRLFAFLALLLAVVSSVTEKDFAPPRGGQLNGHAAAVLEGGGSRSRFSFDEADLARLLAPPE